VPDGYTLEVTEDEEEEEIDPEQTARADELYRFWSEFLKVLKLDDPEQPKAKPSKLYNIFFPLPVPNSWISAYRSLAHGNLGIYLGSTKNTPGRYAVEAITRDFDAIKDQIGGTVRLEKGFGISDRLHVGSLDQPEVRQRAFSWLAERVNTFIRVLRPRIRSAAADYQSRGE